MDMDVGWPLMDTSCYRTSGSLAQPGPWSVAASLDHRAQLLQEAFLDFPCHICPVQPPSGLCCPAMPPPLISRLCLWVPPERSCSEAGEKRGDPEGWVLKRQGPASRPRASRWASGSPPRRPWSQSQPSPGDSQPLPASLSFSAPDLLHQHLSDFTFASLLL